MKSFFPLLLFFVFATEVHGTCYDKYNERYVDLGSEFKKVKRMKNSELFGEYKCTCREGGLLYCKALDIPCYDSIKNAYAPKGDNFYVRRQGKLWDCTCQGGPGRFGPCYLVPEHGSSYGCRDFSTGEIVGTGEQYVMWNFGQKLQCQCDEGRPQRGSCRRIVEEYPRPSRRPHVIPRPRTRRPTQRPAVITRSTTTTQRPRIWTTRRTTTRPRIRTTRRTTTTTTPTSQVDPCVIGVLKCDIRAECIPEGTNFSCRCSIGFQGSGFDDDCRDLDECESGDHDCDRNAECFNSFGSYACYCNDGYNGNGKTCAKMCRDDVSGVYVPDSDTFIKIIDGRTMSCTCFGGEAIDGSCAPDDDVVVERLTSRKPTPTTTTTTTTRMATTRATSTVRCYDRFNNVYHREGATFTFRIRLKTYLCTCVRRGNRGIKSCSRQ